MTRYPKNTYAVDELEAKEGDQEYDDERAMMVWSEYLETSMSGMERTVISKRPLVV